MAVATTTDSAVTEDKELLISGSEAVAEALVLADLDVVTAYPIRPYDTVMQAIAKKIANGQLTAESFPPRIRLTVESGCRTRRSRAR